LANERASGDPESTRQPEPVNVNKNLHPTAMK
jgi:hypothetical protein